MADDEPTFFEQLQSLPGAAPEPTSTEPSIIDQIGAFAEKHAPPPPPPDAEPNPSAHAMPDADPQAILDDIGVFAHVNQPSTIRGMQGLKEVADWAADPWQDHTPNVPGGPVDVEALKDAAADGVHDVADRVFDAAFDEHHEVAHEELLDVANALHGVADVRDRDHDGLDDGEEQRAGTNPVKPDTDGDEIPDGVEVHQYGSNPLSRDTDHDGRSDFEEAAEAGVDYDRAGNVIGRMPTDLLTTPHGSTAPPASAATPGPVTTPHQVDPTLSAAIGEDVTGASSILPEEPTVADADPWGDAAPEAPAADHGGADDLWAAAQSAADADIDPGFDAPAAEEPSPEIFVPEEPAGDVAAAEDAPADDVDAGAIDEGF